MDRKRVPLGARVSHLDAGRSSCNGFATVQEASGVLDYSRLRVCQLLNASAGRVLVTDVLALKSSVPPTKLKPAPAAKLVR